MSYSFNKLRFGLWALVGGWLLWAANDDRKHVVGGIGNPEVGLEYLLGFTVLLGLVWLVTVRVEVSRTGLAYRSLFGSCRIRWREVRRIHVFWTQRYAARILPLYRAYHIEVSDKRGTTIRFGNRVQGVAEVGEALLESSAAELQPLYEREFAAGRPLDFGAVVLTRSEGIRLNGAATVPWSDVVNCELTEQELGVLLRRGDYALLPRRAVSMPTMCHHFISAGMRTPRPVLHSA